MSINLYLLFDSDTNLIKALLSESNWMIWSVTKKDILQLKNNSDQINTKVVCPILFINPGLINPEDSLVFANGHYILHYRMRAKNVPFSQESKINFKRQ